MNVKQKKAINKILRHIFCMILAVIMLYPLIWLFGSSFKAGNQIFTTAERLFPKTWIFSNYPEGWAGFSGISFAIFFKNTAWVTIMATIGAVFSSSVIGYGFARIKFIGSKFWFACMLSTLMLPFQVIMIPQFLIFDQLGWIGTYLPLIVPYYFGQAFFIFLNVQFMKGIPKDLDESAKIDGCSRYTIYTHIILPLTTSPLVVTCIFSFLWRWEDFLQPLIYLSSPSTYVISMALRNFADPSSMSNWGGMFAMSVLSLLPIIIVYIAFQKYLVEGIATTGLKG